MGINVDYYKNQTGRRGCRRKLPNFINQVT